MSSIRIAQTSSQRSPQSLPAPFSRTSIESSSSPPAPPLGAKACAEAQKHETDPSTSRTTQKWKRTAGFWPSLVAICLPLLLSALEGTVVNTALPTISQALNLGTSFTWVATAFLLASTVFQPLYGQLGDLSGRKPPMMVAIFVFAIGSAISGGAHSGAVLILGRITQGLGTGGIDLFSEMILCDIIPLRERGPYTAIKHAVFAVGTALGPLLGGAFAEHGWRWCFLINIPICVVAMLCIHFFLKVGGGIEFGSAELKRELRRVDGWGTLLLTSSVIMILVSLSITNAPYPCVHPAVIVPLLLGAVGLVAFAFFQRSEYCKYPIMPPHIFSNRTTNISFCLTALHGFVTYGFQFYLPAFFQAVKQSTPAISGLQVLPTTLVIVVLAAIGGPLLTFFGRYKPFHIVGFGSMLFGLGLCVLLNRETPIPGWLIFQLFVASGSGILVSSMLPGVQVSLPDSSTGQSSGSWAFLRGTGSLFGVALPGAVFNSRFTEYLPHIESSEARSQLEHGQAYQHASSSFISTFPTETQGQIVQGFTESLKCVWIVLTITAGIGFVLAWFEKEHTMRRDLNSAYGLTTSKEGSEGAVLGS